MFNGRRASSPCSSKPRLGVSGRAGTEPEMRLTLSSFPSAGLMHLRFEGIDATD